MTVSYKKLPLATAVLGLLAMQAAHANQSTEPTVALDTMVVNLDRQGTKVVTNVVTLKEKDEQTATDLRGLLKDEPAIDFGNGTAASQFITIRGMGQNSIDVKVDNAYSDSQILYHQGRFTLDPALVKIVSVQKGAGSASAGIGATNGAIIAKTLDAHDLLQGSDKDWGVKVNAGYSNNKEHSYGAAAFAKMDNFDFLVSGNRVNQSDYKAGAGYTNYLGGNTVPSSASDKLSYLAKAGMTFGDHRVVLSHLNDTDKGVRNVREEFDIFTAAVQPRLTLARQNPKYRELSLTNTNLEYTGKNLVSFIDEVTANAYVMKNKRVSADDEGSYGAVKGRNETAVNTKGLNVNFDTRTPYDTLIKYGVNYRHQEVEPNRRGDFVKNNATKADTGVYVEAIQDVGDFTVTLGGRYDHFNYKAVTGKSVSDGAFNPSLGVIYQATPQISFNANYNHATRSPRLVDALLSGGRNTSIADGTKAERAQNAEIGFNFNNGSFFANGSIFNQKIDGLLTSGQVARHDIPTETYTGIYNAGHATNKGWELNTGYRNQSITARIGVAESRPEFHSVVRDAKGNLPAFSNKEYGARIGRTWTAGLAYRFDNPSLEVGVNHRLVQDVKGSTIWMNSTPANLDAVRPGYNVTDVYANYKPFNNDKLNVNFAVNNIADKDYRTHSGANLPAVGREFRVGVNYTY